MFNKRILAVVKRELREKLSSKSFIIMTMLMPVLMIGFAALITFFSEMGAGTTHIQIISANPGLSSTFQTELDRYDFVKDKSFKIEYKTLTREQFKEYLGLVKPEILNEKINALIYVSDSSFVNKQIEYYAKTINISVRERLNKPINKVLVQSFFNGKLSPDELHFASEGVDFKGFTVSEKSGVQDQSYGNLILSYVVTILLFMGLIQIGSLTMQSVIEEKANRIVEIILSSIKPKELLAGKIIGATITGLFQMLIWLAPIIIIASGSLIMLPKEAAITFTVFQLSYILINFLFGLLIFNGLFAMIGSIFDNPQDAQSGFMPVMLLIMIPYFISFSLIRNPSSEFAVICSLLPIANIIIMPVRFTILEVPIWHLALSILINVVTLYFVAALAGKIYRIGILKTGKKPKWSEVIKWLKYKD